MESKQYFIIFILFTVFNMSKSQLNLLNTFKAINYLKNNKHLKSFVQCVARQPNIGKDILGIVQSIMLFSTKNDFNITEIQDILTRNYDKFINCIDGAIPKFPDGTSLINLNKIYAMKYDWIEFLSCLMGKVRDIGSSSVNNLIQLINKGNYYEALREEFKLRTKGNDLVKQCMNTKIKKLFSNKRITYNATIDIYNINNNSLTNYNYKI